MSLHHAAQHLASKGRKGDTTLVHMSNGEVDGLQALAKNNGTTLTINPKTGLPEAFNLKALIPIAAGVALGPAGFGIASSALGAGLMVGGAYTLGTGSLKQGLMAGLGAYGGATLGAGMDFAGTAPVAGEIPAAQAALPPVTDVGAATNLGPATANPIPASSFGENSLGTLSGNPATTAPFSSGATYVPNPTDTLGVDGVVTPQPGYVPPATAPYSGLNYQNGADISGMGSSPANMGKPLSNFETFTSNVKANPFTAAGTAASVAMANEKPYQPPVIKGDSDMGQRYTFESGYDPTIPGRTSQPSYTQISNEDAKKRYGFAEGGDTSGYGAYTAQDANVAARGLGTGIDYSGYDTAPNKGIMATLTKTNPNQNIVELYKKVEADKKAKEAAEAAASGMAVDGMAAGGGISTLGGYSDGGRLLKGPGDGVSDSIPAVIGNKQPARLADGEFVVPARIVSEIGNGSTEAGARRLYAMMDRVQKARGKTVGKGKVAKNTRADKLLPA